MNQTRAASPRCLIVEDEVLVGMDLEDSLYRAGFDVLWLASARGAIDTLETDHFDAAIIDFVVRSEPCTRLAHELRQRGIPFLVYSGYPPGKDVIDLPDVPWLTKPAEAEAVICALGRIVGHHAAEPGPTAA